jgi:alkaline phosphatase
MCRRSLKHSRMHAPLGPAFSDGLNIRTAIMMLCAIGFSVAFSVTPTPEPEMCMAPVPHTAEQLLLKHGVIDALRPEHCPHNGANKNVILVIGDGMGWEMVRAGAIAKKVLTELQEMGIDTTVGATSDAQKTSAKAMFAGRTLANYYTEGVGDGLSFQKLPDFSLATTSSLVIQKASDGALYAPSGQSMLQGSTSPSFSAPGVMTRGHDNEMAPLALDENGKPLVFDPRDYESEGGMMVLWDDVKGGKYPWDQNYYLPEDQRSPGFDIRFKQRHAPDSANTAGTMATGVKTNNGEPSTLTHSPARRLSKRLTSVFSCSPSRRTQR